MENLKKGGNFAQIVDGIQMNKEKDIFSDLEKDIEGDWGELQVKIRNKQNREEMIKKPRRFFLPGFKKFYKILVDIAYGTKSEIDYSIKMLTREIVYDNTKFDRLPNFVMRLWDVIFNPAYFKCHSNIPCRRCNKEFDVIYEPNTISYVSREFGNHMIERRMMVNRVFCPYCGEMLTNLANAELVSVSLSPKDTFDDEYRRERRYDIK